MYYGKYWYKLERVNGKLLWRYIGCNKPFKDLPDPPRNPLAEINFYIHENDLFIESYEDLLKLISILKKEYFNDFEIIV